MGPAGFDMMRDDPPLRCAAKVFGVLNWPGAANGAENVQDGKRVGWTVEIKVRKTPSWPRSWAN